MKLCLLLALLTVSTCGSHKVVTIQTGQSVTLTCTYDTDYYTALQVCWGRGKIPRTGCSNRLISTDGYSVKHRLSNRYQLLGRLDHGDVSLTILNVRDSDAGLYGCRVEIPGWFNDEKHHFELIVEAAVPTTPATTEGETTTEQQTEPTTTTQTEVSTCGSNEVITSQTGQSVNLTCTYNIGYYKALSVCWDRGKIPASGCSNRLISTDGHSVTDRLSNRYQLLGRLDHGDVSLTILNVTDSDAGLYGCRVDIPGWFNDQKHHFELIVKAAVATTSATTNRETTTEQQTEQTTTTQTEGLVTSAATVLSSSVSAVESEDDIGLTTVVVVCVFFGLVALLTAGGLVIMARRWTRLNKTPQQQQANNRAWFSSTSSTLQLHNRESAIDNVYQIDGDGDGGGGDYEYCP